MKFDYSCNACGTYIEKNIKLAETDDIQKCDMCQSPMVKHLPAVHKFIFKGPGFYCNDKIIDQIHKEG